MELNIIHNGDSRDMNKIDDESVHLSFTSPPYYVGKEYEEYLPTFDDYLRMLYGVFEEVVRVTVPGGKIGINLCDICTGSRMNGGFPEEVMVIPKLVEHLRFGDCYLYARYVWVKTSFPWTNSQQVAYHDKVQHGEYRAVPSWEYVFIFRKGREMRRDKTWEDGRFVSKEEWKDWVTGVWNINSVSRNDYHEAMFPDELAKRVIKLYSFPGDVVLDPFAGTGVVARVARRLGRNYVGYELDEDYWKLCNDLLSQSELFTVPGDGSIENNF
jgi:DNA modification methylase